MALRDKKKMIAEYYNAHKAYLKRNHELFDIYEGNLKKYVENIMRQSLSETYFNQIRHRIMPINILKRIIDKLAKVYNTSPTRSASEKEDMISWYVDTLSLNEKMNFADEFSNLFKGYALEPIIKEDQYTGEGVPFLRILPFDRFFVIGEDPTDPMRVTIFVKTMGVVKDSKGVDEMSFFAYTDDEFLAFTESGKELTQFMEQNEGINIYGKIPFLYGNRSGYNIMPIQDTDILEMAKIMPLMFSDLAGMIMFSCFPINYGIDVDTTNIIMSPNSFWSFKTDPNGLGKTPSIGTITPTAQVDKVLGFITNTLSVWLESRGIKAGSIGKLDGADFASGISKVIDEMDTFEIRRKQIQFFRKEEKEFWKLLAHMHNVWVKNGMLVGQPLLPENWEVSTTFDEPTAFMDRRTEVETVKLEVESNFLDQKSAIKQLYPDLSDEQIEERMEMISISFLPRIINNGEPAESDDTDKQET